MLLSACSNVSQRYGYWIYQHDLIEGNKIALPYLNLFWYNKHKIQKKKKKFAIVAKKTK